MKIKEYLFDRWATVSIEGMYGTINFSYARCRSIALLPTGDPDLRSCPVSGDGSFS